MNVTPLSDIVVSDPKIQGGTPCFRGTRVPVESLFQHLETGHTIDDFLDGFTTVRREQVLALLTFYRHQIHAASKANAMAVAA